VQAFRPARVARAFRPACNRRSGGFGGPKRPHYRQVVAAIALATIVLPLTAQTTKPITITVSETTGIRRNEYPTNARVPVPRAAMPNADHVRLRANGDDVPAQVAIAEKWEDGSVRTLDIDFNVSILPGESKTFQLEYGAGITPGPIARGLQVTEAPDVIQVGNVKFGRSGSPLIVSATYRSEFIAPIETPSLSDANGLGVIADTTRRDLSAARDLKVELLKRGPLVAVVQYTGRLPVDANYDVPFAITCEMPSSKSWIRTTATVTDSAKRVKGLVFSTPLSFGDKPWLWDFGTPNGTYGAMRGTTDSVVLTQLAGTKSANSWNVQTSSATVATAVYESSTPSRGATAAGWGHIYDATKAVAFGVDKFAMEPGTYTISLSARGFAIFGFTPAQPRVDHQLTVYEHFVSTPIPIGAVTSPTAMLNPLVVTVK
jgi:hypothetical protein